MKNVDGIIMNIRREGKKSLKLEGEFEVSSETRERYGIGATSLSVKSTTTGIKIEMNTADLIEALVDGGMTADDLRFYADVADGIITNENPYVPGAITNEYQ